MGFLYKLLKAFNAAQTPWQITLAIVMGMIMGLTPVTGLQTALLFLIALVINIHFGLFLAIAGAVAPVAYLADGAFDALGFALLSNPEWESFWTMLYNNGWARLTAFDNTIVLGSTLVALALALPLYFLLNKLITVYRGKIAAYCQKNRFLSKLGIFTVEAAKPKLFRVWGLGLAVTLIGGSVVVAFFFLDGLIQTGLEKGLEAALGKPVTVERVNVDFTQAKVTIENLAVLDKETQALVLGHIEADVDFNALLLDKTHIERLALEQIALNVPLTPVQREAMQARIEEIEDVPSAPQTDAVQESDTPPPEASSMQMPDVKELLASSDLTVNKRYEEAKSGIETITRSWEQAINDTFGAQANAEITNDFNRIKKEADTKDLKKLAALKGDVEAFNKKIKTRQAAIDGMKKEYKTHEKEVNALIEGVKKAKDEDYKALKSKYTLNEKGAMNVVGDLFGANIQGYVETGYEYYEKIAPYLSSDENVTEPVSRHAGRNVVFKTYLPVPTFWVAESRLSGVFKDQAFDGVIKDITNDQKALGRTTKWTIQSDGPQIEKLLITGEDNRMQKIAVDTIRFSAQRIPSSKLDLALIKVTQSNLGFQGTMVITDNENLKMSTRLNYTQVSMGTKNLSGRMAQTLDKELKQTETFYIDIDGKGTLKSPDLAFKTDLESIVSKALDAMLKAEVARFEKELNAELDKMLQGKLKALTGKEFQVKDIDKLAQKDSQELKTLEQNAKKMLEKELDVKSLEKQISPSDKKKLQKLLKF